MLLLDTSGLLAALFPDQREHRACARAFDEVGGPYLLSPFVLAEVDHLIARFAGVAVELDFLTEVASKAYQLVDFRAPAVDEARAIIASHHDLQIGLADASIVVLARRFGVNDLLTLDEKRFRGLRGAEKHPFRLLPADLRPAKER